MNVILTYKQTKDFNDSTNQLLSSLQFSKVPEMRIIEEVVEIEEEEIIYKIIPYQADVKDSTEFESVKATLEQFGVVDVVGIWENSAIIELDINKYMNALRDIETFELAAFYDGVDFTDKENEYVYLKDDEGVDIQPNIKRFYRLKSSERPTLSQAKETQVNTFNRHVKRDLK